MDHTRVWGFVADMNADGVVTISDVLLWAKWLYFYPGDVAILALVKVFPMIAAFFEISPRSYGGVFSGMVSFFVWLIAVLGTVGMVGQVLSAFEKTESIAGRRKRLGYDD